MASSSHQSWSSIIVGQDGIIVDDFEVTEIDGALLMSLLEESHGEDCHDDEDSERLNGVIRSLEAEIGHDPNTLMILDAQDYSSSPSSGLRVPEWDQLLPAGGEPQVDDGRDYCSTSSCGDEDIDFCWTDMEMAAPSSPRDDDMNNNNNWYMESCQVLDDDIEFRDFRDYYHYYGSQAAPDPAAYYNVSEDHTYGSLWQETDASSMY